jgi:hypothetical protein
MPSGEMANLKLAVWNLVAFSMSEDVPSKTDNFML